MKHHRIVGAMLLTAALNAFGDSSSGTCDTFATGQWVSRGVQPFAECLQMLAVSSTGETISLGRWRGVLIAKDRAGVLLSHDAGRSWRAYQGHAPEPVSDDPPSEAKSQDIAPPDLISPAVAANPPSNEALATPQNDAPAPSTDALPIAATLPPATPIENAVDEVAAIDSPADAAMPTPQHDTPPSPSTDALPLGVDESEPLPAAALLEEAAGEVAPLEPSTAASATDEAIASESGSSALGIEPAEPSETEASSRAQSTGDCRLRIPVGWIYSTAPTLKACAKLLDQSAEQYDAQGYKYAYWRQALLVANRSAVFTFGAESQWTLVLKRHRY